MRVRDKPFDYRCNQTSEGLPCLRTVVGLTLEGDMSNLRFGAFLAPHHPSAKNPLLQFQSNLEFPSAS